jgi:hypothetical protein
MFHSPSTLEHSLYQLCSNSYSLHYVYTLLRWLYGLHSDGDSGWIKKWRE